MKWSAPGNMQNYPKGGTLTMNLVIDPADIKVRKTNPTRTHVRVDTRNRKRELRDARRAKHKARYAAWEA